MTYDVMVVGGSYAGMSAALQLLRARRQVLIVDAGQRRNRFAATSHGFLGQDGADPARIAAKARAQLLAYPTLTWIDGMADAVTGDADDFTLTLTDGTQHSGRRVLFATGVKDTLPPVDGLAERWGRHVFHCPYCHGYELDRGAIAVIASGPMSVHQAQMVAEWGRVTFLTNGMEKPQPEICDDLARRGVRIEETPILHLQGDADIALQDGRVLPFAGIFTAPVCSPATDVAQRMGCALRDTPMGTQIGTDDAKQTNLPGVFACGDVGRVPHSVSLAVGDGAWAGAQIHRSLVFA